MPSYPIPPGFMKMGQISTSFEHFKYTTKYGDGSRGNSQRWKNEKMNGLNMVAGFQFKIGPDIAKRWTIHYNGRFPVIKYADDYREYDGVTLKFPRAEYLTGERGVYMLSIRWFRDGRNSEGRANKEFPHPVYGKGPFTGDFNTYPPDPSQRPEIGNIKDGKWHGFLAATFDDPRNRSLTMMLWYNPNATDNMADYIYLGCSVDSREKPMDPGAPLTWSIKYGHKHWHKVEHDMEIRIDSIPRDQVEIRNMFATEVTVQGPKIDPNQQVGHQVVSFCMAEAEAEKTAEARVNEVMDKIQELQARLQGRQPPDEPRLSKSDILAEIKRIRSEELPLLVASVKAARQAYQRCMKLHPPVIRAPTGISTIGIAERRGRSGGRPTAVSRRDNRHEIEEMC